MKQKKTSLTIGEQCNSRVMWHISPIPRIKENKKGKGSYNRKQSKKISY